LEVDGSLKFEHSDNDNYKSLTGIARILSIFDGNSIVFSFLSSDDNLNTQLQQITYNPMQILSEQWYESPAFRCNTMEVENGLTAEEKCEAMNDLVEQYNLFPRSGSHYWIDNFSNDPNAFSHQIKKFEFKFKLITGCPVTLRIKF